MMKPAIVAVGYNRPLLMKRLLESIGKAYFEWDDIPLIISIDESSLSDEVEKVAQDFNWVHGTKEIRRFPERQGLRKHIVQCGDYSEKYGAVIILEDDLVVSEDFYAYVCKAHERYSEDDRICGVALYSFDCNQFTRQFFRAAPSAYDVFLGGMVVTWGQSWTEKQWNHFKTWYLAHEDKLPPANPAIPDEISGWTRSWGRYFASYMAEGGLSYVYPYVARSTCSADIGEHSVGKLPVTCMQVPLQQGRKAYSFGDYEELVRYDSFYERVLTEKEVICGIPGDQICMDLNNMKKDTLGKRYVVTNSVLPHKKISSFSLSFRPIEMNVLNEAKGDEIYLYELTEEKNTIRPPKKKPYQYEDCYARLRYEYCDIPWRVSLRFAVRDFAKRVWMKLELTKKGAYRKKTMSVQNIKNSIKGLPFIFDIYKRIVTSYWCFMGRYFPKYRSKAEYKKVFGRKLNLDVPESLNEKLMYYKLNLYWDHPLVSQCADKLRVREFVEKNGCGELLNPLLGAWEKAEDIDWDALPNRFALKCNHGSGYNLICTDKAQFDIPKAKETLDCWLNETYGYYNAEQGIYSKIKPMIIAEQFIETEDALPPKDYKFFCSYGEVKLMFVACDRYEGKTKFDYYDPDWNWIPVKNDHPNAGPTERPENLDKMIAYAQKLSEKFPLVRVDFYDTCGKIIFGELTFTHFGCIHRFDPDHFDYDFGALFSDVKEANVIKD